MEQVHVVILSPAVVPDLGLGPALRPEDALGTLPGPAHELPQLITRGTGKPSVYISLIH